MYTFQSNSLTTGTDLIQKAFELFSHKLKKSMKMLIPWIKSETIPQG